MSDEKANTVSSKTLTILSLCVFTAVAAYLGVPVKLGYLDLSAYQASISVAALCQRQRIAAPALALIAVMSYYTDFAIAFMQRSLASLFFFLLSMALQVPDARASIGYHVMRGVACMFSSVYGDSLFFARKHFLGCRTRLYFCLSTVFAVVFAELLWAVSTIIHEGFPGNFTS